MFPDHNEVCELLGAGDGCQAALGYMAVYRLGFGITCYHFLLMIITCGVKSSRDCRGGFHNGMWFYKGLILLVFCFGAFFIPDPTDIFINVWMYTAMAGAASFIIIQLFLLVFLYHSWTDKLVARVDNGGSTFLWYGVVALTASVWIYLLCAAGIFLLFYYFAAAEGCSHNSWFIIVNVFACVVVTVISVAKRGPKDVRLRLLHSSLLSVYVTYLTWSAIISAPRRHQKFSMSHRPDIWIGAGHDSREGVALPGQEYYCGPDDDEDETFSDEIMPYVSLVLTFATVVYSAVGTASPSNCQAIEFPSCPSQQSVQRHKVEDVGGQKVVRNETEGLAYSYPLFHIMIGLASLFLMMSLTDWYTPSTARLMSFGRSWAAVWIKMGSSWMCVVIYITVTLFPTMLPNANRRTGPASITVVNGYAGSLRGSLRSLDVDDDDEEAVPLSPSKPTNTIHQETTV
ncbi:hypothetical protein Pcinc_013054 [Petrolisthes cinctipes]|nr:hypothetical protein Pcinc_013054 [Petrolisthes cinctipes]